VGDFTATINYAQQREFDKNEAAIGVRYELPQTPTAEVRNKVSGFVRYCEANGVRAMPAVVASYVDHLAGLGLNAETILNSLQAIEALHDCFNCSNPVQTGAVNRVMEGLIKTEPPRSWPKAEKIMWALLPPIIRDTIARRESERDKWLRQQQNEAAAKCKQPNQKENANG